MVKTGKEGSKMSEPKQCIDKKCDNSATYEVELVGEWTADYCGPHFQRRIQGLIEEFRFEPGTPNEATIEIERYGDQDV